MTETQLIKLYEKSLIDTITSTDYLLSRKLNQPSIICGTLFQNGKTYIAIPVYSSLSEITSLVLRNIDNKEYLNLLNTDYQGYAIYNIQEAINHIEYVVVTEGIFDAMTLIQEGINAISVLRATYQEAINHSLPLWDNIIFALDNDETGREQTKKNIKFLAKHYPNVKTHTLDFYDKDINEALINGNIKDIVEQIKSIV